MTEPVSITYDAFNDKNLFHCMLAFVYCSRWDLNLPIATPSTLLNHAAQVSRHPSRQGDSAHHLLNTIRKDSRARRGQGSDHVEDSISFLHVIARIVRGDEIYATGKEARLEQAE